MKVEVHPLVGILAAMKREAPEAWERLRRILHG
jgi:hypothetical protein